MRVPDRPLAETDTDGSNRRRGGSDFRLRSEDLADRLKRLHAGHPSADVATDLDQAQDRLSEDDTDPDGAEDEGDDAVTGGVRPRHRMVKPARDDIGGKHHDSYRPWFSADGATDPWFAEPIDGVSR